MIKDKHTAMRTYLDSALLHKLTRFPLLFVHCHCGKQRILSIATTTAPASSTPAGILHARVGYHDFRHLVCHSLCKKAVHSVAQEV